MAGKFDWGDGRKVHSRKARPGERARARKRKAASEAKPTVNPYDAIIAAARGMAEGAFAPSIRSAQSDVDDAGAQGKRIDAASDRHVADLTGAQGQVTQAVDATTGHQAAATTGAVAATSQLGTEQAAQARAAQDAYGQSAAAAEDATRRAGAGGAQLLAHGNSIGGFMGALGAVENQRLAGAIGAQRTRQGEQQTELRRETTKRKDRVNDLRRERASKESEIATGLLKEEREYELAQDTLGQRNADSKRDFTVALKTIAENRRQNNIADSNADEDRKQSAANDANDPAVQLRREQDLADDGKVNGSVGGSDGAGGKGTGGAKAYGRGAHFKGGRDGHKIEIRPDRLTSMKVKANELRDLRDRARKASAAGGDVEKALSKQGLKGRKLEFALTALRPGGRIPRNMLPFVSSYLGLDPKDLPQDFARRIDRE